MEKWITPSLFIGKDASDEYGLCVELGSKAETTLNEFRSSFITRKDFKWIKSRGLDTVRIPVGYWISDQQVPYVNTIKFLDLAMKWAQNEKLKVIISFHGAPGSQNGKNHSGKEGSVGWHKNYQNIQLSLKIINDLTVRYKDNPYFFGIELLNEPYWKIPRRVLKKYYDEAYKCIRSKAGDNLLVIINDHYKPGFWKKFSAKNGYINVLVDRHIYQAYKRDSKRNLSAVLGKVMRWKKQIIRAQRTAPLIIGEWSLALHQSSQALKEQGREEVMSQYGKAQLDAFSEAAGWFYWTYKTEDKGPWNFVENFEKGWIKSEHH